MSQVGAGASGSMPCFDQEAFTESDRTARSRRLVPQWVLMLLVCMGSLNCASATRGGAGRSGAGGVHTTAQSLGRSVEATDASLGAALLDVLAERTPDHLAAAANRYYRLGISDKAMDLYSEAIRLDRRYAAAFDGRARVWRDWGMMNEALGDAHRATFFAPRAAGAWNTLGTVLQAASSTDAAAAAYRAAIAIDGRAAYAWNNLCYLSFLAGETEAAIEQCSSALAVGGRFPAALNNLALVYAAAGDMTRAVELFGRASTGAVAQYNLGIVRLAQKDYAAAARAFEAASRAEPRFEAARSRARQARAGAAKKS